MRQSLSSRRAAAFRWRSLLVVAAAILAVIPDQPSLANGRLSRSELAVAAWVDRNAGTQLDDLQRLVDINSGTHNVPGVRAVGDFFATALRDLGFEVQWVELPPGMQRAGHLVARRTGHRGRRLLLIGHLDTVFPVDSPFQRFARDGSRATGPGVDDMKDGDLVILYALRSLHAFGLLEGATITVVLTGDEEDPGQPASASREALIRAGEASDVALGFESGHGGNATIGRRGAAGWTLEVSGQRAHSAGILSPDVGAGAAYEIARIIDAFRREIGGDPVVTVNPGLLLAGTETSFDDVVTSGTTIGKINVVAESAVARGDLRFLSEERGAAARAAMQAIVARNLPHTRASLSFRDYYPAMAPAAGNRALLAELSAISEALGAGPVQATDPLQAGAGDISFVARYVSALEGLGSWGGANHSHAEFLEVATLPLATKRAAILIHRLTR